MGATYTQTLLEVHEFRLRYLLRRSPKHLYYVTVWQFQSVWTDWRSVLEQMNLHFCFSLYRNEWCGTPCRVLRARPFSSTCYNSNKKRHTISESPLNLEYVSSAQRPSQYQAEMRYVSATFSVARSKSVNKLRQLQCTRHLDFLPE